MNSLNESTTLVLFRANSKNVSAFHSKLRERFQFDSNGAELTAQLGKVTTVTIEDGAVKCYSDPIVRRAVWRDPLEERDLFLITADYEMADVDQVRDLLNFGCPNLSRSLVTLAAQPNPEFESGCRVSVACSRTNDVNSLGVRIPIFTGNKLLGMPGVMLGVARELEMPAYAIVIEYAPSQEFASSEAIKAAMRIFSQISGIDLHRGKMSDGSIRLQKHLKKLADKRNEEYRARQAGADYVWRDPAGTNDLFDTSESYEFECIESDLRRQENVEWIEELFDKVGDGSERFDRDRAIYLKSELDRLGLYEQFEGRFLSLFRTRG